MSTIAPIQKSLLDFEARAIAPMLEMGAYEYLWAQKGATFKKLAALFRDNPDCKPSELVSRSDAEHYGILARKMLEDAGIEDFGVRVHGAGEYPPSLRDAENPVELLYFQGNWDFTSSRCVAIVGTRNPSDDGRKRAAQLARRFIDADFTIVSGLAQGIDTAAHIAAVESHGRTIAVLGTPLNSCYPAANRELQSRIASRHLVISQVPIVRYSRQSWNGNRLFFPERNITMSALTEATVIVEAGNTSGTLIQARHALQQRRKLFILNSCFENKELTWPAKFLERGAIRVNDFQDIRAHLDA